MSAITATDARKNLFGLIQQVNNDHAPVELNSIERARRGEVGHHDLVEAEDE
jgi:hypothetical protein